MYQIGDKVVYPVHGAGVVEAIESREIGGRNRQYYVLNLPYSSLRIMVPMEEAENVGLRSLMPTEAYDKVLQILEGRQEGKASPAVQAMKLEKWNNRFRMQMSSTSWRKLYTAWKPATACGRSPPASVKSLTRRGKFCSASFGWSARPVNRKSRNVSSKYWTPLFNRGALCF